MVDLDVKYMMLLEMGKVVLCLEKLIEFYFFVIII